MPDLNHTHQSYDNFVLESRFKDQYESKLDLMQFCEVDDSLVGVAGDKVKINTYTATNGTQTLVMGEGNTENIEVGYETKEYVIELLQNRFPYYDEEEMRDPLVVQKGIDHMAVDMFNTVNGKAMTAFTKASIQAVVKQLDFDAFVDGVALFPNNEAEALDIFCFINSKDKAKTRKLLKDDLKYIEAYVRTGYIGTVNGVNLYVSNIAKEGEPILATKGAVTYYRKKGIEIEQDRDKNIRLNKIYSREYGIFAFTDATKAVKLIVDSTATATKSYVKTVDTELASGKTYYTFANGKYTAVSSPVKAKLGEYFELVTV